MEALEFPRFDVFVPKSIGPTWAALQIVPRRGREAIGRALQIDRALLDADRDARAVYEARAAASAPARRAGARDRLAPSGRSARAAAAASPPRWTR